LHELDVIDAEAPREVDPEEALARSSDFRAAMGTIPAEVGIEEPPKFFPAHTVYLA